MIKVTRGEFMKDGGIYWDKDFVTISTATPELMKKLDDQKVIDVTDTDKAIAGFFNGEIVVVDYKD